MYVKCGWLAFIKEYFDWDKHTVTGFGEFSIHDTLIYITITCLYGWLDPRNHPDDSCLFTAAERSYNYDTLNWSMVIIIRKCCSIWLLIFLLMFVFCKENTINILRKDEITKCRKYNRNKLKKNPKNITLSKQF